MKVKIINDCAGYHCGSYLVTREIRRKIAEAGMVEGEPADILLVNGEGTLHHDAPGSEKIRREIQAWPCAKVCIINAVWQQMSQPLRGVSLAAARESRSAEQMKADGVCSDVIVAPDISLCCQHRPEYRGGSGMVVIDSVVSEVSRWLADLAAQHGATFVEMCKWNKKEPEALIDLLAGASCVVTGRFHGVTFSMLAGVPFFAAPSNTWKTEALMQDFGLAEHYHASKESMLAAIDAGRFAKFDRSRLDAIGARWRDIFERVKTCEAVAVSGPAIVQAWDYHLPDGACVGALFLSDDHTLTLHGQNGSGRVESGGWRETTRKDVLNVWLDLPQGRESCVLILNGETAILERQIGSRYLKAKSRNYALHKTPSYSI